MSLRMKIRVVECLIIEDIMKVEAVIARIVNGPVSVMEEVSGDRFYFVEAMIDVSGHIVNHTFFYKTRLTASNLLVGDVVFIGTGGRV